MKAIPTMKYALSVANIVRLLPKPTKGKNMTNDFTYNMSEINEEEIVRGWEEINGEDADYIPGLDDGEWLETDDEWLDEFWGEEDFA